MKFKLEDLLGKGNRKRKQWKIVDAAGNRVSFLSDTGDTLRGGWYGLHNELGWIVGPYNSSGRYKKDYNYKLVTDIEREEKIWFREAEICFEVEA